MVVFPLLEHPFPQFVDNRQGFLQAEFLSLIRIELVLPGPGLHGIQLLNKSKRFLGPFSIVVPGLFKFPSGMGPTVQVSNTLTLADSVIGTIAICLEISFKISQYMIGSLPATATLVIKEYGLVNRVMVHPIIPLVGGALFVSIDDLYRGFIGL